MGTQGNRLITGTRRLLQVRNQRLHNSLNITREGHCAKSGSEWHGDLLLPNNFAYLPVRKWDLCQSEN